jgi:lipopolysaccharide biosynthesis protein
MNVRPIAIYLPQYHPVPENDKWWGKGFTEWANVTKAKPLFKNHYQPHLPADLGFYDLRLPEVREEQAKLASEHGIYGFCYYHYWFNGRKILERPFEEVFKTAKPDFPFMLCWANESWTRNWGIYHKNETLIEQSYSDNDDRNHIKYLLNFFEDERYIKVNGKPVITIYDSLSLPDAKKTLEIWREEAFKIGMELYICRFERSHINTAEEYLKYGFDAAIDFQPFGSIMGAYKTYHIEKMKNGLIKKVRHIFYKKIGSKIYKSGYQKYWDQGRRWLDYKDYVNFAINTDFPDYKWFPGITPMWDNTARRGKKSFLLKNADPDTYQEWLESILKKFKPYSNDENFFFINAWNEWAEGNHLEPCLKWGMQYLEATSRALELIQNKIPSEQYV